MTRARAWWCTTAVVALVLGWVLTSAPHVPPLYDGVGLPDEPYRFVHAPAGYRHTPAPTSARVTKHVSPGGDDILVAASAEQGPQVTLILGQRDLRVPGGATSVTLDAQPVAVPRAPSDGVVWGNAYRVSVTAGAASVAVNDTRLDAVSLRSPTGPPPAPRFEFYDGTSWHRLGIRREGNDIWSGPAPGNGVYALVVAAGTARTSQSPAATAPGATGPATSGAPAAADPGAPEQTASSLRPTVIALLIALAAIVVLVVLIRVSRSRRRPSGRH